MHTRPLALVVLLVTLAACGGTRRSDRSTTTTSYAQTSVLATESAPTAAEPASAPTSFADDDDIGRIEPNGASLAPSPAPGAIAVAPSKDKLVVEGWVSVSVDDVPAAAAALRALVERGGGRVISEQIEGAATSWSGTMTLRLPPGEVDVVVDALGKAGTIVSKRLQATDVTKTLFDQKLAIDNLRLTAARLGKLYESPGLQTAQILEIEREMTRIRGEIERIEGEKRFLEDRVALATLQVNLSRDEGPLPARLSQDVKFYPGPRIAWLHRFDAGGADRDRFGGGVALHLGWRRLSVELDLFGDPDGAGGEDAAGLLTLGGAFYSDLFGYGLRRWLNPYIGFRAGYAHLGEAAFAAQAELGVELFKAKYVMIDASVRATALLDGDQVDGATITGASAVFAF
jgi:hypothetical protein